ncbi:MAG: hypothetical protein ACREEM_46790 [Blastocatellia bacterium]
MRFTAETAPQRFFGMRHCSVMKFMSLYLILEVLGIKENALDFFQTRQRLMERLAVHSRTVNENLNADVDAFIANVNGWTGNKF